MRFTNKDKNDLLIIARNSLIFSLNNDTYIPFSDSKILQKNCGAFISMYFEDNLICEHGKFKTDVQLYKFISDMSVMAIKKCKNDNKITKDNINNLKIEISILSDLKKVLNVNDIQLDKHGIYMTKNDKCGYYFPQEIIENKWSLFELLGHCSQDKMNMKWDEWKSSNIFIFESEEFNEK